MRKYYLFALIFALLIFLAVLVISIERDTSDGFWRHVGSWFKRKARIKKQIELPGKKENQQINLNKNNGEENPNNQYKRRKFCKDCKYLIVILDDAGLLPYRFGLIKYARPLNFSIIPGQPFTYKWINYLKKVYRHEIMIHIPMAAISNPKSGIKPGMKITDIKKYLYRWKAEIRFAKGANNHQGSLATSTPKLMNAFFKIFKNTGLYYVDSITSNKTKAYYYARKHSVPALKRHYFLDNKKNTAYIVRQFKRAVNFSKRYGYCVVIGHATSKNMIKALKRMEKIFKENKIRFITVSEYLKLKQNKDN